ncbi:MAG TPA: M50 family metallopeptidase [Candidatus Saccharimonadales bacterium]
MEIVGFVASVILGLLLLVLLVVVHELGHAIAARRNGVVVEEFGIGFPPKAWSKKLKNGVLFTLNYLPLGGFVKLQGEHDAADKPGDYGAVNLWAKTKILLAGVLVNYLVAAVIFTGLALFGLPKVIENQFTVASDTTEVSKPVTIVTVGADSPAMAAGLKKGDEIIRFAGERLNSPSDLTRLAKDNRGKTVEIIYNRDGRETNVPVKLRATADKGFLGVGADQRTTYKSTWSAPIVGVALTGQLTVVTLQGLGDTLANLFTGLIDKVNPSESARSAGDEKLGTVGESVAGPLAILGILFPSATEAGIGALLFMTALISLALAIMNLLPIPALDGGRWFVTMVFHALRRPLSRETEERIHGTGFLVLMGLFVLVTIADIGKFSG